MIIQILVQIQKFEDKKIGTFFNKLAYYSYSIHVLNETNELIILGIILAKFLAQR